MLPGLGVPEVLGVCDGHLWRPGGAPQLEDVAMPAPGARERHATGAMQEVRGARQQAERHALGRAGLLEPVQPQLQDGRHVPHEQLGRVAWRTHSVAQGAGLEQGSSCASPGHLGRCAAASARPAAGRRPPAAADSRVRVGMVIRDALRQAVSRRGVFSERWGSAGHQAGPQSVIPASRGRTARRPSSAHSHHAIVRALPVPPSAAGTSAAGAE